MMGKSGHQVDFGESETAAESSPEQHRRRGKGLAHGRIEEEDEEEDEEGDVFAFNARSDRENRREKPQHEEQQEDDIEEGSPSVQLPPSKKVVNQTFSRATTKERKDCHSERETDDGPARAEEGVERLLAKEGRAQEATDEMVTGGDAASHRTRPNTRYVPCRHWKLCKASPEQCVL